MVPRGPFDPSLKITGVKEKEAVFAISATVLGFSVRWSLVGEAPLALFRSGTVVQTGGSNENAGIVLMDAKHQKYGDWTFRKSRLEP